MIANIVAEEVIFPEEDDIFKKYSRKQSDRFQRRSYCGVDNALLYNTSRFVLHMFLTYPVSQNGRTFRC